MRPVRRHRTTVQQNGRIEICAPDLTPGQAVEVTVRVAPPTPARSIVDILAECPGGTLFKTAEDVETYVREERDSWDR